MTVMDLRERASGGPVTSGMSVVIGERGCEYIWRATDPDRDPVVSADPEAHVHTSYDGRDILGVDAPDEARCDCGQPECTAWEVKAAAGYVSEEQPTVRKVWMSEELFQQLGASRVDWGEPDAYGFYTPTVYGRWLPPVVDDDDGEQT